jgi:hypothetical protein
LFILVDTDSQNFPLYYDEVNELDDNPVVPVTDLDYLTDYTPGGSFHVVDTLSNLPKTLSRWEHLVLASLGARVYTESPEFKDSPLLAGPVPAPDKARRIAVDGVNSDGRASYFAEFGVNYVGRTKLDPRNIFILDNKKSNPLHDPSKDPLLETLYASLPDDWWGSCGFVSTGNPDKLKAFLEDQADVIPLTWTTGGQAKLKYCDREFVTVEQPNEKQDYGVEVRDLANRLSYNLSFK